MSTPSLIVRPARKEDLPSLLKLAQNAGLGMTTVPNTEEALLERIEASDKAFAGSGRAEARDIFFFVLDNGDHAVGMASIFPDLGADRPFYSYRRSHIAAQAPESGLKASSDILFLVNDFHGYEEIGTLLVGKEARGQGAGRLLSLSRLMFMGTRRDRFGENVMAEIRGWFNEDGTCPFWEHIAAKFFHTTFDEADRLSANDFRFISHLMPKFPIYVSLLPEDGQEVIGKPHKTSGQALKMLLTENFAVSRCIDIFDGGPSIQCPIDRVRTVQERTDRRLTVSDNADHIAGSEPFLVSTLDGQDYACAIGTGHRQGQTVVLSPAIAEQGGFKPGALVAAAPLRAKE
ncbi:arginine N-succinyltransferase [Parvularcula marina]|uniref:arginine N-succinyltransferase n=1 Tax=Parvularcula marina TaxID=2292771 RepID=UPI001314156C|nr:arginine N-succinyltransferase [Parvularcula marina]